MVKEFKLPHLGENIKSGDVVKVLVSPGQTVQQNDIVLELETDKAVVEVPATLTGTVVEVKATVGQKLKIDDVIFTYTSANETHKPEITPPVQKNVSTPETIQPSQKSAPTPQPTTLPLEKKSEKREQTFFLPPLGENILEGQLVKILVQAGESVHAKQNVLEVETDKAVIEVPFPEAGVIKTVSVIAGQKIKVGSAVFTYESASNTEVKAEPVQNITIKPSAPAPQNAISTLELITPKLPTHYVLAAPSVRKLAREIGVDLLDVKSQNPSGRITTDDVKAHAKRMATEYKADRIKPSGSGTLPQIELPDFSRWGAIESKPMSNIRKATALRMTQAWNTIPQVTQTDWADVTLLEDLRKRFGKRAEDLGTKLTSTAILLKIVGSALKVFPQFNATIDVAKEEIIYKKYIHVGVAVDTDRGLLVPVVRDVNKKNIIDLAKELGELSEKARQRKTTLEEMQGGTFTISNLGGIGGGHFTPIVNPPEVAILGVGKWNYQPVYIDGEFKPRKMLPLSLTYDHRLIDGADTARFLRWICEAVQDPFLMELEG